jgi:hypothetical protein
MAFEVAYEPKKRFFWSFRNKRWNTVFHRKKNPKCSFCGYKFKSSEIYQKPTKSLADEKKALKEKHNKNSNVRRKKHVYHQ